MRYFFLDKSDAARYIDVSIDTHEPVLGVRITEEESHG